MFVCAIFYYLTIFVVVFLINKIKYKTQPLPKLKINKNGIFFNSTFKHKIKIDNLKILIIDKTIYLKNENNFIIIQNVTNIYKAQNYLFFSALGDVKILFKTEDFYRYFNILIKSNNFNLTKLKQMALLDILNNLNNINNCKILNKYINFIKNILKIKVNETQIQVMPNKYNFTFTVIYKLNNVLKKVQVNKTL